MNQKIDNVLKKCKIYSLFRIEQVIYYYNQFITKYFAILVNKTKDITKTKQLSIVVCYFYNNAINSRFLEIYFLFFF